MKSSENNARLSSMIFHMTDGIEACNPSTHISRLALFLMSSECGIRFLLPGMSVCGWEVGIFSTGGREVSW